MAQFVVGNVYCRADSGFAPVKVTKRTEKTIWVKDTWNGAEWYMRVRKGEDGNEWAVDYETPANYRRLMMFHAKNISSCEKGEEQTGKRRRNRHE